MSAFAFPATLDRLATAAGPRIDWRRVVVPGLLMGAAARTQDTGLVMVFDWPLFATSVFLTIGIVKYGSGFMAVAWLAQRIEGRWTRGAAWAAILVLLPIVGTLQWLIDPVYGALADPITAFKTLAPNQMLVPNLWVYTALGSLFFAYCLIMQRSLRVRDQLARAELERGRTAVELAQAQGDALAARVEPAFMLRALTALRAAYDRGDGRADALLDALVAFLRLAMPAVRTGRSTLLAELALLRAHAQLVALIEPGRRLCSVDAESPACDLPFPPLVLVPLVEAAAVRSAVPPHVSLTREGRRLKLAVQAPGSEFDDELLQPLDRALRRLYPGEPVRFTATQGCLTLRLPLSPGESEQEIDDERTTTA